MNMVQRVLSGRRVSIPDSMSKDLGIQEGDYVIVKEDSGGIRIVLAEIKEKPAKAR